MASATPARKNGIVVTIDGPSGAGKSTAARLVARRLGYRYIDTGAMYRALALLVRRKGISLEDCDAIERTCRDMELRFQEGAQGLLVLLGGEDVSDAVREPVIGELASTISTLPEIRKIMVERQRSMAKGGGVVIEGRDIGSVVCPDAEVKIFLEASVQERAKRRHRELAEKGIAVAEDKVREEIEARDLRDRSRRLAPLCVAEGAVRIDSTMLSIDEVVEAIMQLVCERLGR